jgi:hypothetical protein
MLPGNKLLLEKGGKPLRWPTTHVNDTFAQLLETAQTLQPKQHDIPPLPSQPSPPED